MQLVVIFILGLHCLVFSPCHFRVLFLSQHLFKKLSAYSLTFIRSFHSYSASAICQALYVELEIQK